MRNTLIALCLVLTMNAGFAQSYHFSQFFSTPLLTNPAHTGFTDGPYRVATNLRTQGMQNGNKYVTGYLSGDVSLLRDKLPQGHKAGVGMFVMNDHTLTGAVQNNSLGLSTAYNVGLDTYGERSFGLGLQGTYYQRKIDYSKLTFENQYGPNGYDAALPIGEPLDFQSKHFFDVNAGILYSVRQQNRAYFAGVSVYNILQHNENLLSEEFNMPTRLTFQGGFQWLAAENQKVYLSLTSMQQAGTNETTLGGAYGLVLTNEDKDELIGGLWYRYKDAFIPYIGYQRNNLQFGISYDYTVSSLRTSAGLKNAFELTLLFKAINKRELKTTISWY